MIPKHTHFVITLLWTIDSSLDGIAVVVYYEDDGLEAETDVGADFLDGHLERSFSDQKDDAARKFQFFLGDECS